MVHAFGEYELDDELFQLRRRGKPLKIEPKVFDVLAHLIRCRHRVVSKDDLLDAVWPGLTVTESVLPKCVAAVRRAVGDTRARPRVIQTVHGRGYRFIASVEVRAPSGDVEPAVEPPTPAPEDAPSSFVGRARVLEHLRKALDAACAGRGRLVLLVGEPGIGKTRTAEELAAEARRRHALVLIGHAYEGEGAPAFWPWVQILRACARWSGPSARLTESVANAPEIAALIPELGSRTHGLARARPADGDETRFRLFEGVTTFLKRTAERQPLVIVLDDLHWADEASLRLLRLLASEVGDARLLVVATCRDQESQPGHPLAELLGGLAREPTCEWISLLGFEPGETETLIGRVMGAAPPHGLAAAVHTMTEGNPFFIQEIARLLVSEGALATASVETVSRSLPQRVRDAIDRRLSTLSRECRQLLRVASVLGREFDATLLARVAELPPERVLQLLAEGRTARVLDAVSDGLGRYAFHHVLIRRALYDDLAAPERVRLHRRAGERLEEICGADADSSLDELAHHFFEAAASGDAERAVSACVRAAERAHRLLAYEQSARQYERALQACELAVPRDEPRRSELLLALGEARSAAGERDAARAAFARAAAIARRLQRADLLARAALGDRGAMEMGAPVEDATLALLEEALAAVGEAHPALRARLLSRLVGAPPHTNAMETRDRLSREAFALAQQEGDTQALRDALSARLWACLGPERIDARLEVARELLALAERQESMPMALLAYDAQLGAHLLRGEMEEADRALAAYTRVAEELRQPALLFHATFWQGSRALAGGDLETAEALFRAALERGRGTVPYAHFMFTGQMYPLVYLRGEVDDVDLSRVFFGEMMDLPYSWAPAVRSALVFSLLVRGERDAARREFDRLSERGFDELRRDEHWLITIGSLASVAVQLGDRSRGALLYDLLLPYADLVVVHDLLRSIGGSVASTLGHLATLLERYDEGATHYEWAIVKESAMGARLALLDSKAGYAHLLGRRNRRGDRARAESLRDEVRAQMAKLGIRRNWVLDALEPSPDPLPRPSARKNRQHSR